MADFEHDALVVLRAHPSLAAIVTKVPDELALSALSSSLASALARRSGAPKS